MTRQSETARRGPSPPAAHYRVQYEFLLAHVPLPIFVLDPENDRILEANPAACRLLGYPRETLVRRMRISDIHPDEMALFHELSREVLRAGRAQSDQLTCLTADRRSIPVRVITHLTEDASGRRLLSAIVVETGTSRALEQALTDEVRGSHDYEEIVGTSSALARVMQDVERVAPTDASVLIVGETGTGKEIVCRALHHRSRRRDRPLVKLNCAAIPSGLVESELFGHEKGAFTGAVSRRLGRFELAHEGTVFLDEIGDLAPEVQPKLLRLLQEREFERVGGTRTLRVDARLIVATHRDLATLVTEGRFREDLFYRLNVFPIRLPPLRERRGDIPLLARYFIGRFAARHGRPPAEITPSALARLDGYPWPGNVRELENVIERAIILHDGSLITEQHLLLDSPAACGTVTGEAATLVEVERAHVRATLDTCGWRVSGRGGAAERLGLKPNTLASRMKRLGITRPH